MKNVDDKDLEKVTGGAGQIAAKPVTMTPGVPEPEGPPQASQTD